MSVKSTLNSDAGPGRTVVRSGNLFVVSNLGQVRNAAAVIRQLALTDVRLLALWTEVNPGVLAAMRSLADHFQLKTSPILLPRSPTDLAPWRIREMSRIIDGLTAQYHTEALWLSNANSFYGYLAHRYSQSGASINLFEEGLGTYRSVNDPPFVRHHLRHRVSSLIGEVRAALTNPDLSLDRRVRRAGHRVVRFTGRTRPGELITEVLTLGRARHFIRPWTRFARAIVAFPSLLDPELVRSTTAIQLMIDATHTVDDEQKSAVDPAWVKDHESAIPVFLCQRYGVPMTIWGEAIASEILNLGIHEVLVKHHPRETPLEREEFIASLRDAGVSAVTSERFDTWPAEWLIYRGLTNHVIGLTSSTLVYRPPAPHHVTYSSLADGVLERLRHDARVPESTLTRFATDLAVFDRVFLRLAASQQ